MLDRLVIWVQLKTEHVSVQQLAGQEYYLPNFDIKDLGLELFSNLYKDEQGQIQHYNIKHFYEKIPTSNTEMSAKFFYSEHGEFYPYVELKASPAKVIQGHNVYGSDFILMGALEMLGFLALYNPKLYKMLDVQRAEVKALDITYSAKLKNNEQVAKAIEYLRNVSTQHIRKSKKINANTVYFGSERCKRFGRKVYGKYDEFMSQLDKFEKLAKQGDKRAGQLVNIMRSPILQSWAYGRLRFETTVKAYALKELGYPTNLIELCKYQRKNHNFLKHIWTKANQQLFDALKGEQVNFSSHDEVLQNLKNVYGVETKSGRMSYTKALNLFNFFRAIELDGLDVIRKRYAKATFQRLYKDLQSAGYSKSFLQNLHTKHKDNIKPFIEYISIDFDSQVPDDWKEPYSIFWSERYKLLQYDEAVNDGKFNSTKVA